VSKKPVPIDLTPHAAMLGNAREFLRMWATPNGPVNCFINPVPVGTDPAAFGVALVDSIRLAAKTWSRATGIAEKDALERIWKGLDSERANPTDTVTLSPNEDGLI
jgi:Domain of unknown function (DUF5076)